MNQIIIDKMVNENNIIQDEKLRNLMHDTFDNIFKYLGKENFLRWINMRNLSDRIKKLSIEEFSTEDKDKHTTWNGFYTLGTDRIKLRDTNDLNVNIHETYHFITDVNERFPTFINEGLTEYLNMNTLAGSRSGYTLNVNVVKFLHNVLGDSLIKAYLTGNISSDKKFELYFSSYVSNDGKPDLQALQDFYKKLDTIHNLKFNSKEKNDETAKQRLNLAFKDAEEYLQNIASNYIAKKAQNLDYYSFGKLDFSAIKRDIQKINTLLRPCCSSGDYLNIENNITRRALSSIIENSPLIVGCDNKDELISSVIGQIFREAQVKDERGVTHTIPRHIDENKANELFNNRQSVGMDLAKLKLDNNVDISKDGKFDIIEFIRQVGNIEYATDMTKTELDTILGNYILQNCPNGVDVKRIESIVKDNLNLIKNLYDIKYDREKHTIESIYFKLDDNKYLEKRDGKQFLVTIDPNGEIHDKPYNIDIDRIYSITSVGKEPKTPKKIGDIDALKVDLMIDKLHRNLDSKDYKSILSDAEDPFSVKGVFYTADVDMRSRVVNFPKYIADIKSILAIIPDEKQDEFVNNSVEKLLKDIYGVPKKDCFDLYSIMQNDVKYALKTQKSEVFEKNIMHLNENTASLNNMRRTRIEENNKHALIGFKTPEVKIIYSLNQKAMRSRQLENDEREFVKNSDLYVLDKESLGKHESFPGLYILGAWNCPFKASIDIDGMTNGVKSFIQRYPENERIAKAQELSRKLLRQYYGRESSRTIQGIDDQRSSIYDGMQNIICNRIFNEKDIDLDSFNVLEQNMHDIINKEYDYYDKRSAISFVDEQTKEAYNKYQSIQSRNDIPQDIKEEMLSQIKDLNGSRLKSERLLSKAINLTEERCRTSQINEEVGKVRTIVTEKDRKQSISK